MDFLIEYGLFVAKSITIVVSILIVIAGIIALSHRQKTDHGQIKVEKLNDALKDMADSLKAQVLGKDIFNRQKKLEDKQQKKAEKTRLKSAKNSKTEEPPRKKCLFVLNFEGDIKASDVDYLREEVSTVLSVATSQDEVFIRLESGGGMVHAYGLAASQLARIRQAGIPLVIGVDKVAASGGYMMACVANKIIAAPFAIIGSIGVLGQLPNFNRLLKKHHIDYEQHTAGEYKRTLTLFGENTKEDRAKFTEELEETHTLFKAFIQENRSQLDISTVATGEHWYGTQALEKNLIDAIQTTDDYLMQACQDADVFLIQYEIPQRWSDKISHVFDTTLGQILNKLWTRSESTPLLK